MRAYQNLEVTGSVNVTGSITANNMSADNFFGTSSYAATSSYLSGSGDLFGSLTGSMTGSLTGSISGTLEGIATGSFTGSFFGEFSGSGANLYDISASSIIGLNLARISTGSVSASAYIEDETGSFHITNNTYITGSLTADTLFANSASITHLTNVYQTSSYIYLTGSTKFGDEAGVDIHEFTGSVGITGSLGVEGPSRFKDLQITGSVGISGSLLVSGTLTVVGTDGSSLQINVPSDPTTGSLFAILDTNNNSVFEVFADKVTRITGSVDITGSLGVTGGITGSLLGTASYALATDFASTAGFIDGGLY
jgi:hypothetical protein